MACAWWCARWCRAGGVQLAGACRALQTAPAGRAAILPEGPAWSVASLLPATRGGAREERDTLELEAVPPEVLEAAARLANLSVTPEDGRHLQAVLGFVRHIQAVDTAGVAPLVSVMENEPMRLRADDAAPFDEQFEATALSGRAAGAFYVAPQSAAFQPQTHGGEPEALADPPS